MSFVAISKVKYPDSLKEEIHNIGLQMVPIAKQQPGFISIRFHQAHESNVTMMYWEWESKSNHDSCMASDAWADIMEQSKPVFEAEGTKFSIETYERLA
ncbi:antibiotic biosynthesis monooxygenase family protein [Gimesia aquarii]|uniref:Antibiotic biosynthesis monooxygenase n=1 Tax=Gimesia aquarii TaxID=2527964 RepID=A0A517VXR6_9PLAN|nr:antibiotic biosynthesis monooxygenase [Gimesia aquarii]QDT97803.1 Antibiotic biosynthesis monooxygenase [Gimesia aquarii]